jgi:hypothetical protein
MYNKYFPMDVCFFDIRFHTFKGEIILDELCVLNVNDIFKPLVYTYKNSTEYCPECLMLNLQKFVDVEKTLFYVDDDVDGLKLKVLKLNFPKLRLVNFNNPEAIEREECCYLNCVKLCKFYLKKV